MIEVFVRKLEMSTGHYDCLCFIADAIFNTSNTIPLSMQMKSKHDIHPE